MAGGAVPLEDADTLNFDDSGFSRTELPAGGGGDLSEEEKEKDEVRIHVWRRSYRCDLMRSACSCTGVLRCVVVVATRFVATVAGAAAVVSLPSVVRCHERRLRRTVDLTGGCHEKC